MKKTICFIAQFPPPIHGLSKAIETLYTSSLEHKYAFKKIDITNSRALLKNIWGVFLTKNNLFYFTISQTRKGNWRDLVILKLLQWQHKKCLIHLHGGYYRKMLESDCGNFQRRLNYKLIRQVNAVIVLGSSLVSIFQGMIDENKIFIVPNCVDNQYILNSKMSCIKVNGLIVQPVLHFLYLSNFIKTKGYRDVLLLALKMKKEERIDVHFHFAGKFFQKEEKDYFTDFISNNHLAEIVTYYGVVSGKEKCELLRLCNVFILLTRYPNEGQPISILEAMGNAMAIVTTNHAGIPDVVKDGENGLVVDKEEIDLESIYSYLSQINDNRELLKRICERNYQIATTQYTEQQYIANMDKVFQTVLKE